MWRERGCALTSASAPTERSTRPRSLPMPTSAHVRGRNRSVDRSIAPSVGIGRSIDRRLGWCRCQRPRWPRSRTIDRSVAWSFGADADVMDQSIVGSIDRSIGRRRCRQPRARSIHRSIAWAVSADADVRAQPRARSTDRSIAWAVGAGADVRAWPRSRHIDRSVSRRII